MSQDWKNMFLHGGKQALLNRGDAAKSHAREVENLKRIIGEITVANDILKKPWREQSNEDAGSPRGQQGNEPEQGPAVLRDVQARLVLRQKAKGCGDRRQCHR